MDDLQKLILQDIGCYCNLSNLNEWNYEDRIIKPLKHNGHFDFSYSAGVTKVVLLLPGQSYVIKIPFSCLDDENPDDAYCSDFCNAPLDADWDYCLAETRIYSAAEEAGVEICFAKTSLLGYADGYPIYIQPRAVTFENDSSSSCVKTPKTTADTRQFCADNSCWLFDVDWFSDCLATYGKEIMQRVVKFIQDLELVDFHNGNIGYIDGAPVLIDYGDFRDGE